MNRAQDDDPPSSLAARRIVVMLAAGAAAAAIEGFTVSWWYAGVIGWLVACITYILWVWIHLWRLDPRGMRVHATREDPGAVASDLLIIGSSVASLAAVALILIRAAHDPAWQRAAIGLMALVSVALSWFLIHTLFAQRYARDYYREPTGGIDFLDDEHDDPVFSDFLYLAFDLGMTYQISDTAIRTTHLRRVVLRHSLLSYLFGTVILATTTNLVAGLG